MTQVVTANRLRDGAVVFRGAADDWVELLQDAQRFDGKDVIAAALEAARADEAGNRVVDVYAVDVTDRAGFAVPVKLREAIRARGPTVHPEFAKAQLEPRPVPEDDHVSV